MTTVKKTPLTQNDIAKLLDDLAKEEAEQKTLSAAKQAAIGALIPPDILAEIEEIEEKYDRKIGQSVAVADFHRAEIKEGVLNLGWSVNGEVLQAVFNKGRTSWDTKALEGVLAIYPDLAKLKKQGQPYVSFKAIKR